MIRKFLNTNTGRTIVYKDEEVDPTGMVLMTIFNKNGSVDGSGTYNIRFTGYSNYIEVVSDDPEIPVH